MSDNRKLVSDIRDLDRDVADCEDYLAKVLSRKTETSRQPSANKKKNVASRNTARPESRGQSQTRQRAPSAGVNERSSQPARKPVSNASSTKKNSSEQPARPIQNDGSRKRSNSVSRLVSQGCRCESAKPTTTKTSKQPHNVYLQQGSSTCHIPAQARPVSPPHGSRPKSPTHKNKDLLWGEILKQNHTANRKLDRASWDISRLHKAGSRQPHDDRIPIFNTKVPHDCERPKECNTSRSHSSECTAVGTCTHYFKVPEQRHNPTEESFSSEGTSGFSSNNDLPSNLTNKSVQCGSPIPGAQAKCGPPQHYEHRRISSCSSSGASSQKVEDKNEKAEQIMGSDHFAPYHPVRTLHFLLRELQGKLPKTPKEDVSIHRIIADMDKVLQRLPEGGELGDSSSGYTTRTRPPDTQSMVSGTTRSSDVPERDRDRERERALDADGERAAVHHVIEVIPALARRIDERTESMRNKIMEAKTHISVPSFSPAPQEVFVNTLDSATYLQRVLEHSSGQLEMICRTMEQTCVALWSERDLLKVEIDSRDKELRVAKSQEQDLVTTVNSLRTSLTSSTRRATQLSMENKLLQEQVKEIPGLKHVADKYKQLSLENALLKEQTKALPSLKQQEEKIAEMTLQIQQLIAEKECLEEKVAVTSKEKLKLKEEIQCGVLQSQAGMAEATKRLTQRLQDMMKERDDAQHEQHMLRIEREKLLVLSQQKEKELARFVSDILNIKNMVTEQMKNLKDSMLKISSPFSISDMLSLSSDSDEAASSASQCQPMCSSPTSTNTGFPPVGDDWRDVSTIVPEQTQSSPEILVNINPKNVEETAQQLEFRSIAHDSCHDLPAIGQGEDVRMQPKAAYPSTWTQTHPTASTPGETEWTGAEAATQELQQNVKELFKLINCSNAQGGTSATTAVTYTSNATSARTHPGRNAQPSTSAPEPAVRRARNFRFEMPVLPDPPKFLETPEFSDFSSYHGSLADSSSVESIDAVLRELQKDDHQHKNK